MAFRFPDPESEVRLARPPLREVICQLRYPPILRIGEETPAAFQEMIRHDLPELEIERALSGTPEGIIRAGRLEPGPLLYRFKSSDGNKVATLAIDFLAVSTTSYSHWDDFVSVLLKATDALEHVYQPAHCTRIGLRYINLITPTLIGASSLGEAEALLNERLRSALLSDVLDDPIQTLCQVRARVSEQTSEKERFALRSGLTQTDSGEVGYLLDFDCYVEGKVSLDGLEERCSRYHGWIYRAFRWCLVPDAIAAFGIEEVS